jgi:hypothetical protein
MRQSLVRIGARCPGHGLPLPGHGDETHSAILKHTHLRRSTRDCSRSSIAGEFPSGQDPQQVWAPATSAVVVPRRKASVTGSSRIVLMQGELKDRAPGGIRGRPQASAVRFGDQGTDRQSHAHCRPAYRPSRRFARCDTSAAIEGKADLAVRPTARFCVHVRARATCCRRQLCWPTSALPAIAADGRVRTRRAVSVRPFRTHAAA